MQGRCPKCNRAYEISDEFVAMGGRAKCPHCLQELVFQKGDSAGQKVDRFWEPTKPDPRRRPAQKLPAPGPEELEARCPSCGKRYRVKKSFLEAGGEARCLHCDARLQFPEFAESTKVAPQKAAAAPEKQSRPAADESSAAAESAPEEPAAAPPEVTGAEESQTAAYGRQETARISLPELDDFFAGKDLQESETEEHQLSAMNFEKELAGETKKFNRDQLGVLAEEEEEEKEEIIDGQLVPSAGGGPEDSGQEPLASMEETADALDFPREGEEEPAGEDAGPARLQNQPPSRQADQSEPPRVDEEEETALDAERIGDLLEPAPGSEAGGESEGASDTAQEHSFEEEPLAAAAAEEQAASSSFLPGPGNYSSGVSVEYAEETLDEEPISDGDTERSALAAEAQAQLPPEQPAQEAGEEGQAQAKDWARAAAEWAESGFDPSKMPAFVAGKGGSAEPPPRVELPQEMAAIGLPAVEKPQELMEVSDSDILEAEASAPPPQAIKAEPPLAPAPVESPAPSAKPEPLARQRARWPFRLSSPYFLVAAGVVVLAAFAVVWWLVSREDVEKYAFPPPPPAVKSIEAPAPAAYRTRWEAVEHYGLGNRYAHQGRFEDAVIEYKQASRIDPGFPLPHRALGAIYAALGNRALSLLSYETYLSLDPAAPDARIIKENIIKKP
jgi:tetratricopeptide (TPR) repeat protein